jgi:hypothetical protein
MRDLDLQTLPPELLAALERAWPSHPEAQRRAVLGPWAQAGWRTVWPDFLWPWQPARRWWRPGTARQWRGSFERYFASQRCNLLQAEGPRLFDPAQPFFDTPWTHAGVLLRSPVPDVFTDAEFWAVTQQIFDGDVHLATSETRAWAGELIARQATARGPRRERWWAEQLHRMHAAATSTYV